jgi:hypothetical protein
MKMLYVGSHYGSTRISLRHGGYVCSSRWMKAAYKRRPSDFMRRIVYWQSTPDRKELLETEKRWLSLIPKGELGKRFYNLTRHNNNWIADYEGKQKTVGKRISDALRGRKQNPECVAARAAALRGKKCSDATKAKISVANRGRKHSPEQTAAHNAWLRGRKYTPEQRAARRGAAPMLKGSKHSAETVAKLRAGRKPLSPATRAKLSAALIGKPRPPAVREKIRAGHKARGNTKQHLRRLHSVGGRTGVAGCLNRGRRWVTELRSNREFYLSPDEAQRLVDSGESRWGRRRGRGGTRYPSPGSLAG